VCTVMVIHSNHFGVEKGKLIENTWSMYGSRGIRPLCGVLQQGLVGIHDSLIP